MFHTHLQNRMCIESSPLLFAYTAFNMFQIKFSVEGEEIIIPLGSAEDEETPNVLQETTQHVLVAKDSGLISDEAYHEVRMSLPEDARVMVPPVNAIKDERNRQNKIMDIHQITEVRDFFLNVMTLDYSVSLDSAIAGFPLCNQRWHPEKRKKSQFGPFLFRGCRLTGVTQAEYFKSHPRARNCDRYGPQCN